MKTKQIKMRYASYLKFRKRFPMLKHESAASYFTRLAEFLDGMDNYPEVLR